MASTIEELFDAIEAEDDRAVRRLLGADPALAAARDAHAVSALMRALYRSDAGTATAIREHLASLDVFEASTVSDTERLREVLDAEPALATVYSGDGFTPLHFAAFFGHAEAAELLLARGAEVNAFGRGWMTGTALHSAVARSHVDVVRILLDAGANSNARQSAGWSPLHSAAHNGDVPSLQLLLAAGADPAATNDEGRSVLDLAEERGDPTSIDRIREALQTSP
jgi:ankyrin repeat protein